VRAQSLRRKEGKRERDLIKLLVRFHLVLGDEVVVLLGTALVVDSAGRDHQVGLRTRSVFGCEESE
jgi:hypothetical protein